MLLELATAALPAAITAFGASKSSRAASRQAALDRAQAQEQFDQQMDYSVQRRVSDAKKAGIHPLFAMGASVGASPTFSAGQKPGRSASGEALQAAGRNLNLAGVRQALASAARDEAEAAYINSQRKRLEQDTDSQGRDLATLSEIHVPPGIQKRKPYTMTGGNPVDGMHNILPAEVVAQKRTGVAAGTKPAKEEFVRPDGSRFTLWTEDVGDEIKQVEMVVKEYLYQWGKIYRALSTDPNIRAARARALAQTNRDIRKAVSDYRKRTTVTAADVKLVYDKVREYWNRWRSR